VEQAKNRNLIFISLSQFGVASSANFITVMLPFYIFNISPYSPQETLIWIGWIMGSSHFVVIFASNLWGMLTSRFSPKLLYMRGLLANLVLFFIMGFTSDLRVLLLLRILQGVFGGISTVGLIIISSSSSQEKISSDIGFFQTFQTMGFLVGPPMGAFAASAFGYKGSFVSASVILFVVLVFCHLYIKDVPLQQEKESFFGRSNMNLQTVTGWLLCFMVMVQLMFLPSILPNVFESFSLEKNIALQWAGVVIMLYTATATFSTYFWPKFSRRVGKERMILFIVLLGSLFQALLSFSRGAIDFIVIRMIQTGLIAGAIPLVISIFAVRQKGNVIGFLNSGRFAGHAFGPVMATSVLAVSNLPSLYLLISGLTLLALLAFNFSLKGGAGCEIIQGRAG
jgi:DHA1 family multidrug resistance protein-like MFS transporter